MTRGDAEPVTAAVTLDQSLPPSEVLETEGGVEASGIVVTCVVEARLDSSSDEFEIEPTRDWIRRSFETESTRRWTWFVTPKIGGTQAIVLYLRPIVSVAGETQERLASSSNVKELETTVDVSVPWTERPAEVMTRIASTANVAVEMVTALTVLVGAIGALLAALGIKRWWSSRKKKVAQRDASAQEEQGRERS
jgi:hypothetical protein